MLPVLLRRLPLLEYAGGAVGGIMLNVFAAGASYETIVAVAVILSLAVSAFFSAGSHLYLCFYYCIKYRL